jgi:hypothetical protein
VSYQYAEHRNRIFTEEGQRMFLEIHDAAKDLLSRSGAFTVEALMNHARTGGDSWLILACLDRLEELDKIRRIDQTVHVNGQDEIYVRASR